jgi:hypothetical protein
MANSKFVSILCRSQIRYQAAIGSWTRFRQWETQRTLFSSARVTVWAAQLGIARSTLESKIRTLGINKNRFRGRPAKP